MEVILPHLPTSFKVITEEDGKSALIWMLGEYGEVIHVLPGVYKLEILIYEGAEGVGRGCGTTLDLPLDESII